MSEEQDRPPPSVLRAGENLKSAIEIATAVITAVAAVVGFVSANGGVWAILMEIGLFGFAVYVALIPAAVVVSGLGLLEAKSGRKSKPAVGIGIAVAVALILALIVRFQVFDQNLLDDLDAFGSVFVGLAGIVVLLIPLAVLWWFKGSTPTR